MVCRMSVFWNRSSKRVMKNGCWDQLLHVMFGGVWKELFFALFELEVSWFDVWIELFTCLGRRCNDVKPKRTLTILQKNQMFKLAGLHLS